MNMGRNEKLEAMLTKMKENGNSQKEHSDEFVQLLKASTVIVPAIMPKDTDPAIMRQMMQNPGKELAVPAGAHPQPCILENDKKKRFLAVFTSEEELRKNQKAPRFPLTLNMEFQACEKLLKEHADLEGIVINAFTQNVIYQVNQKPTDKKEIKVTIEQFHILTRNKMESFYLPKHLFDQKEEFITKLCDKQGAYMKELYDELYTTEVANPYTEDDFEFISLNISEALLLVQITMPQEHHAASTCSTVYFAWNRETNQIWYYAIVNKGEEGYHLHQLKEDGSAADLGEAPAEGNELNTILEMIQND